MCIYVVMHICAHFHSYMYINTYVRLSIRNQNMLHRAEECFGLGPDPADIVVEGNNAQPEAGWGGTIDTVVYRNF